MAALEASFESDDITKIGGLFVSIVGLGCPPGIGAGLSVRSQEIKVQVDQGLDFSL